MTGAAAARERGNARKDQIRALALSLAEKVGYRFVTRTMIAEAGRFSPSVVSAHWTAHQLQTEILRAAVHTGNAVVVAQGLADRHPAARSAPLKLRRRAAATLIGE